MRRYASLTTAALVLLGLAACAPASPPAPAEPASAGAACQGPLDALIAQARADCELDTASITETGRAVPQLVDTFNKRFGLDLKINVALGDQAGKYSQLFAT